MQLVCCVCHKTKQQNGWEEILPLPAAAELSHGYCPSCYRQFMEQIRRFFEPVSHRKAA